jgi:hypothetical protein
MAGSAPRQPNSQEEIAMPPQHHGLLDRLDRLVDLAADRRGLALRPDGRLAPAEARAAARAADLEPSRDDDPGALGLLRALAEAVGLLRVRGGRLEATALRPAWGRVDPGLRAGLVYAAWCHRVPWEAFLPGTDVAGLAVGRRRVLRLLYGLPAGADVAVPELAATVADSLGVAGDRLARTLTVAFLEPLVALGVAELDPPAPGPPARLRLGPGAATVIGSALVAVGEEVPLGAATAN